jgi:hypothetical protein
LGAPDLGAPNFGATDDAVSGAFGED